ncbi:tetratricopeptide repeat protein [Maricaulis sp. MIT060901]|uniref:tetratricopeptide repeat protein n=1 Tax=Maricaulis sp. MIT060901 TaxID=3096993 RepID=UPI0039995ED8
MRILFPLALALLSPPTALAQSSAQLNEHQRYSACMERIATEAVEAYEDALAWKYDGGGWPAEHCQARALIAVGDPHTGASLLESIASLERPGLLMQERLDMWLEAGTTWLEIEDFEAAERSFAVALALVELSPHAMLGHAKAYLGLEQFPAAETAASNLIEIYPDNASARAVRAEARLNLGTLDQAMEDILVAIEQQPDVVEHYVLRGRISEAVRRSDAD